MSYQDISAIPMATFKNIIVTGTVVGDNLKLKCVETIVCTAPDTILNFQLLQENDPERDYCFGPPVITGDTSQLGPPTISNSGKMLTMCNSVSNWGDIQINLEAYNRDQPTMRAAFDPQVVNRPEGGLQA
jgi:hypothetical protein